MPFFFTYNFGMFAAFDCIPFAFDLKESRS